MLVVSGGYTEIPELGGMEPSGLQSTQRTGPWDCQGLWAQASFPFHLERPLLYLFYLWKVKSKTTFLGLQVKHLCNVYFA